MSASPERAIAATLHAVERRHRVDRALLVAAVALPLIALSFAWWTLAGGWYALAVVAAAAVAAFSGTKGPGRFIPAIAIERSTPSLQNVLITAVELIDGTLRTSRAFHERVIADAGAAVARVSPKEVAPLGRSARAFGAGATAAAILVMLAAGVERRAHAGAAAGVAVPGRAQAPVSVSIRVTPPPYLRESPRELLDPERVDVIAGSSLDVSAPGALLRWVNERGAKTVAEARLSVRPEGAGFVAVEQGGAVIRVVPVAVEVDEPPRITVERPQGDLLLPAARPVIVGARASDDHGLSSAELRYTRVSGSGEQFEFISGVLPVEAMRQSDRSWTLESELPLTKMGASPGDTIVFRVAARDARAANGEGLSDAVVVEIAGPGRAVSGGAAIDPTEDTFALSQQMILLKLRRLHAARRSLDAPALLARSQVLAAEQRSVRALFVFMLGGEVEDEEVEAAHSHEIQEGRMEDASRRDLAGAVNLMSRVEQHLTEAETAAALPPAQAAVDAVQRAFGRRRYFLRTTPVRMRIDPSRRLTGDTSGVAGVSVGSASPVPTAPGLHTIQALIGIVSMSDEELGRVRLADIAANVLAGDPRAPDLQHLAQEIQRSEGSAPARIRATAGKAISALAAREQVRHPGTLRPGAGSSALASAWADEWRKGGSR